MAKGWIHSVESLGTQDGPGIRYVVFTQGCPLRCKYCHNPDTWCMTDGQEVEVEELMNKILRCKPFISRSKGGITISGGEPTLQIDFVLELLKRCKEEDIHTALDTSGYVDKDKFEKLLPYTDLVLLDIKHIDDIEHQELTGVSNQKILDILNLLEERGKSFWVRHVVVPGINDKIEYIEKLTELLAPLDNLEKVELISYHQLGVHKWETIGLDYELKDVEPPSGEKMEEFKEIFINKGINTVVK
ncbi:pyruvate formate lyase activating enzyme [Orenia metallireducens]|uniref:Pyruvate formate-lyase-activating enzyme n=1 Tax=Orenia metallireducens TaxID=1413210 RepID=A0A285G214_9FIRM|nr:pyruvate formate-lyase-activating protein [Orenia metallireducens]PRX31815.1 pyruvate formate lyase activating enzyme [Orenia metallireducens]SNY17468.1 pyruvate formate lyase activating enzyme [Orenia metallireducens]